MSALRWIICFPGAWTFSFLAWLALGKLMGSAHYGRGVVESSIGLTPLLLRAAVPALVFAVAGPMLSPSKERKVAFVFLVLSFLFSAGGFEILSPASQSNAIFWSTAAAGVIGGSVAGLSLAFRIQDRRKKKPNQSLEPTPTSVTSPAAQEPRRL